MTKDARIDDIALFFSRNGKVSKSWVPHSVYADPAYSLGPAPAHWRQAIFMQQPAEGPGTDPFYVANLSSLLDPGVGAGSVGVSHARVETEVAKPPTAVKPAAGDIVVIPWSDPATAYLVPRQRYQNEIECPSIGDANASDLKFMAITEGVVVANLPKTDLAGMTCYLLNLLALRPMASFPGRDIG